MLHRNEPVGIGVRSISMNNKNTHIHGAMLAVSDMVLGKETVPVSKIYLPSVLIEFTVNGEKEKNT